MNKLSDYSIICFSADESINILNPLCYIQENNSKQYYWKTQDGEFKKANALQWISSQKEMEEYLESKELNLNPNENSQKEQLLRSLGISQAHFTEEMYVEFLLDNFGKVPLPIELGSYNQNIDNKEVHEIKFFENLSCIQLFMVGKQEIYICIYKNIGLSRIAKD